VLKGEPKVQVGQADGAGPVTVERDVTESAEPRVPIARSQPSTRSLTVRHELPSRTILQMLVVVAGVWLFGHLWSQLLLFAVALLLASALEPVVTRLENRGWPRGRAVGLIFVLLVIAFTLLIAIIVPPTVEQGRRLIDDLPTYMDTLEARLEIYPEFQNWLQNARDTATVDSQTVLSEVYAASGGVASGVASAFILLAATAYLLLDGPGLFAGLVSGMAPHNQTRATRIRQEIGRVVGGYLRGQLILSTLFGVFSFVTLSLAGVPEPVALAVLAAFFDAIPLVGATLATIPAVLLALTVSAPTALVVLVLYIAYQQVENYVISPRVFGKALEIPPLAILVAVTVGSTLLGILGALLALPIAAAIPAVARAWRDTPAPSDTPEPS
jgi:predicted PurR-regulated permease PerM